MGADDKITCEKYIFSEVADEIATNKFLCSVSYYTHKMAADVDEGSVKQSSYWSSWQHISLL